MATSGALSTSNDNIKYKITITQNSQSVANNTSNVTVSVRFYRTNTGYETYGTGTVYCTINGTQYTTSVTSSQKITSSGIVLFSKILNIAHNSDGKKTLTVSAHINHDRVTSSSQSFSQTLTTIARKSTLTASNGTLETAQTLTINRQSSSFTHTITYKCGTVSGTIATKTTATSVSFTPPDTLANQNTKGTSVEVVFTVTTYSGNTNIGSNTKTITCTIPATDKYMPKITGVTTSEAVSGIAAQFGKFVNNVSRVNFEVATSLKYGATISTQSVKVAGQSFSKLSGTTAVISVSSNVLIFNVSIKDSRGRTATYTYSISILTYTPPSISNLTVERCNNEGTGIESGQCIKVNISAAIASMNSKNTASLKLYYKQTGSSNFVRLNSFAPSGYSVNGEYMINEVVFSADNSYQIKLELTDYFDTISKTLNLSSASAVFDIQSNGNGISFNKISERSGFMEIAFKMWSAFGDVIRSPISLASGDSLDNLTEIGFYIVPNTEVSPFILGKPPIYEGTSSTAFIEVLPSGDGLQRILRYYDCSKNKQLIWQKLFYSGSWGEWQIVGGCSSWANLSVNNDFELYSSDTQPKYRINGNTVTVTGALTPKATITSNTTGVKIADGIPQGFRPQGTLVFVCQGSGINRYLLQVNSNGELHISRYGANAYVNITAGSWLPFTVTYSI